MTVKVHHGDCLEILPTLAADSIDAVVTDPPYGLGFMGKDWDSPGGLGDFPMRRVHATNMVNTGVTRQGGRQRSCEDFTKRQIRDARAFGEWCEAWAVELLRVLKPGAHLIAFGGTRTYHRMACAIEDAGFEIRDQIQWLYGSGFPKSRNIGDGRGTALKPAHEPIVLARKSLIGNVAANVERFGTGAINIDACRIGDFENTTPPGTDRWNQALYEAGYRPNAYQRGREGEPSADRRYTDQGSTNFAATPGPRGGSPKGRWPANIIHDGSDEVMAGFPETTSGTGAVKKATSAGYQGNAYGKESRKVGTPNIEYGGSGSAGRFFYTPKADDDDRLGSKHPTVKPVDLIAYLCRLITPRKGIVLDPFAGSGSTGMACLREGFDCILIEREDEYVADINRRIAHVSGADAPLFASTE